MLSELTLRELETAPEGVRLVLGQVPADHIDALALSPEAKELAAGYIAEGAVGERMRADALHIALATVARVDVLVSWNFKHICESEANPRVQRRQPQEGLPDSRDPNSTGGSRR